MIAKLLSTVMLLIYGSVFPANGGIVLCVEKDGHFHFEFANGDSCAAPFQSSSSDPHHDLNELTEMVATPEVHCPECQDYPLAIAATAAVKQKLSNPGNNDYPAFFNYQSDHSRAAINAAGVNPLWSSAYRNPPAFPLILSSVFLRL